MKININKHFIISSLRAILISFIFLIIPDYLFARPGGGHSYSGGRSVGGGFSSGGDDGLVQIFIYLLFNYPEIGVPLLIAALIFYRIKEKNKAKAYASVSSSPTLVNRSNQFKQIGGNINELKRIDENFSKILFFDFVGSIYNKFYDSFATQDFRNLKPFISENLFKESANTSKKGFKYSEIVIGNMQILEVLLSNNQVTIVMDISANYTLTNGSHSTRYVVDERWAFSRKANLKSSTPDKMRDLKCPNCGAPSKFTNAGQCEYCDTFIRAGEMQWFVSQRYILNQETFSTKGLGHYEAEVGTNYPTIVAPNIESSINMFLQLHGLPDWSAYWKEFTDNIVSTYFKKIYNAWDELKWEKIRHLLSDRLYYSYSFWIDAYHSNNMRNRLGNIQINRIDMASIDIDKYYESFTVRIFASCLDYVEDKNGRLVGGSKKRVRVFSEYWTFIRRAGLKNIEKSFNLNLCPNCGAPADKMGQSAICEYCNSKISNGDFSWILMRIVQDEEYR